MIFNGNKQLLGLGDFRPKAKKLPKGNFTLRFQIRHDSMEMLEKLKNLELVLEKKLSKPIHLSIYSTRNDALTGGSKFPASGKRMRRGRRAAFFIGKLSGDALPKDALPGDILSGTINYYKKISSEKTRRFQGDTFKYIISQLPKKQENLASTTSGEDEDVMDMNSFLLLKQIEFLEELLKKKRKLGDCRHILDELLSQHPKNLQLLALNLKCWKAEGNNGKELREAADALIANIDTTQLALHFCTVKLGSKSEDPKVKKEMEKQKEMLINALEEKAQSLVQLALSLPAEDAAAGQGVVAEIDNVLDLLRKWTDVEDARFHSLHIDYWRGQSLLAHSLKVLNKALSSSPEPDRQMYDLREEVVRRLGWHHWAIYFSQWRPILFPHKYAPF